MKRFPLSLVFAVAFILMFAFATESQARPRMVGRTVAKAARVTARAARVAVAPARLAGKFAHAKPARKLAAGIVHRVRGR